MHQNKKILIVLILIVTITCFFLIFPQKTFQDRISELREETVPMFDSLSKQMNQENKFHCKIMSLIESHDTLVANQLVDSAIAKTPHYSILYTYKGMIYAAENKPLESIQQYDKSISIHKSEFPLVLSKKAEALISLKNYSEAIINYKKAVSFNEWFNCEVAKTFDIVNEKDSALKYYLKYQKFYPEDTLINARISLVSKK